MYAVGGARDGLEVLVEDHREVESMFDELAARRGTPEQRRRLVDVVIAELVRHFVAEELHLYPLVRRQLDDGDAMAVRTVDDHIACERAMKRLEGLDPADTDLADGVDALISDVRSHFAAEERDVFPRLRGTCPEKELVALGEKVERTKAVAPTRPHPSAPGEPPTGQAIAVGAGLVDRIRDAFEGRTNDPSDL